MRFHQNSFSLRASYVDSSRVIQWGCSKRPAGGRRLRELQFFRARWCICRINPRNCSPNAVSEYSTCGRLDSKTWRRMAPSSSSSRSWAVRTFWLMPGNARQSWLWRREPSNNSRKISTFHLPPITASRRSTSHSTIFRFTHGHSKVPDCAGYKLGHLSAI